MTIVSQTHRARLILALCSLFFLTSCDSDMVFEKIEDVPGKEWKADAPISFSVPVEDTISMQNVLLTVRNGGDYSYSNLFLFVTTTSPSGASVCDTVEVTLADNKGRWYGKGFASYYDIRVPYKRMIKFPMKGDYTVSVVQGMREKTLTGIVKIGVRVEKAKNK